MRADFDLTADKFNRASVTLGNHAFAVLTEGEKEIRVDLSNYRYDCTDIWESDDWKPAAATSASSGSCRCWMIWRTTWPPTRTPTTSCARA